MNSISDVELASVAGGGWLADRVHDALCWLENNSAEIGAAYERMYASGLAF